MAETQGWKPSKTGVVSHGASEVGYVSQLVQLFRRATRQVSPLASLAA